MDNNFNPTDWSAKDKEFRPAPPPPPPPEITLRTLQSDVESIKQSGGESVTPQAFTPPELKKEIIPPTPPSLSQTKIEASAFSKSEEMPKPVDQAPVMKPKSSKGLILSLAVLVVVLGLGAVGYFVVYPKFFASEAVIPAPSVGEVTPPPQENIPEVPSALEGTLPPMSGEVLPPISETVPPPVVRSHSSYFATPADLQTGVKLTALALTDLSQALNIEGANKPSATNALKEVVITDNNGQVNFNETLPLIVPEITSAELSQFFAEDFTAFIYYDINGAWSGYVAKLKDGASAADAKTLIARLETSLSLPSFYQSSVGAPSSSGFKSGNASGFATRYLAFSTTGASLNYGWANNYLVISTSYNGIKSAMSKLGQ